MKVRYTLPALADLHSILEYVAAHSPQGAKRVQGRIQRVIDVLSAHPGIGVHTDDPVIRRLSTPPYPYSFSTKSPALRSSFMPFDTRPEIHSACLARNR